MSYLNSNGLVDGNIPAGQPCSFASECAQKMDRCPTEGNVKECAFSCALARLNSLIAEGKGKGQKLPLLEGVKNSLNRKV